MMLLPYVAFGDSGVDVKPSRIVSIQNAQSAAASGSRTTSLQSRVRDTKRDDENIKRSSGNTVQRGTVQRTVTGSTGTVSRNDIVRNISERGNSNVSKGIVARAASSAVGSVSVSNHTTVLNSETVATAKSNMQDLNSLRESCKQQYAACMDNFCNKIDDNMGRCSCNKGVKNYAKTEEGLRVATEELQEVAQKIQYLGLTPTEIKTLFTQTEAEDVMQSSSDSTKLKNDLDRIKNMLIDVKSGSAGSVTADSGISFDMSNLLSFDIDSNGFNISSLFSTDTTNTQSISNQRGEALYKSGAARCKAAVLNTCTSYGIDTSVIINGYDLEIDKDCIQYERKLKDENSAMLATIRNAKTVLQKARLMVAQQKNQYDLRGCIAALDSCMQDDFVCGDDYIDCVDPTGKYVVDGKIVSGSKPGVFGGIWGDNGTSETATSGLYAGWNYNGKNIYAPNASFTIQDYIAATMDLESAKSTAPTDISTWLQTKMGYHDDKNERNYGMCVSVLNKCQKYTYDKDGKYLGKNIVISNWLERAFQRIKKAQDDLLMSYASTCLSEVQSCLSQNNYSTSGVSSTVAIQSCLPVINSCRSVTGDDTTITSTEDIIKIYEWLDDAASTSFAADCEKSGGKWNNGSGCGECPADKYMESSADNRVCKCMSGFTSSNTNGITTCVAATEASVNCLNAAPRKEWKDGQCVCTSEYPNEQTNGDCLNVDEYKCPQSGGSFDIVNNKCVCGANQLLVSEEGRCVNIISSIDQRTTCEAGNPMNYTNCQGDTTNCAYPICYGNDFGVLANNNWVAYTQYSGYKLGNSGIAMCSNSTDGSVGYKDWHNLPSSSGKSCWCKTEKVYHSAGEGTVKGLWVYSGTTWDSAQEQDEQFCAANCPTQCAIEVMQQVTLAGRKMLTAY